MRRQGVVRPKKLVKEEEEEEEDVIKTWASQAEAEGRQRCDALCLADAGGLDLDLERICSAWAAAAEQGSTSVLGMLTLLPEGWKA
ncbi:hypothetical protein AK812_SmicGene32623 [Symbiodinium microadriaticum]|uniref:Uncharacterized protein n=1 Tax=Symbiodinium microadriaticum TaxID=2951 RepID=A0A1Q9CTM2_SYMMI|nr:hypothetical protein AK812_SmicGene32623 [Symbiodinium microadriaticum]